MPDALILLVAMLACATGFGWLALAMAGHWRQVVGTSSCPPTVARRLRVLAGAALSLSLALCLMVDHPSMAALVWIMMLTASALSVAFTLTWRPGLLAVLAPPSWRRRGR